ncbi:hypothetical protein [Streptomyces sp. NPDC052012]|uniref:hypothetical protein n=1 Tax=Streptomyces sp. NPDC052012 TaxID=3155051 RepID=UPI00344B7B5B
MSTGDDLRPRIPGRVADRVSGRMDALRGTWTALCAAAAVVLGPAARTASTLTQANAAPRHQALGQDGEKAAL